MYPEGTIPISYAFMHEILCPPWLISCWWALFSPRSKEIALVKLPCWTKAASVQPQLWLKRSVISKFLPINLFPRYILTNWLPVLLCAFCKLFTRHQLAKVETQCDQGYGNCRLCISSLILSKRCEQQQISASLYPTTCTKGSERPILKLGQSHATADRWHLVPT